MKGLPTTTPLITPTDRSYRPYAYILLIASIAATSAFLDKYFSTLISTFLYLTFLIFPTVTFLILTHLHISPSRAAALKLTTPPQQYASKIRWRAIMDDETLFKSGMASLSSWIVAHSVKPLSADGWGWWISLGTNIFFAVDAAKRVGETWWAILKNESGDMEEVKGWKPLNEMHVGEEWSSTGLTVVKHNIWVRRKVEESGEEKGGIGKEYEVAVCYAPDHKWYKEDKANLPVGKVLRVNY